MTKTLTLTLTLAMLATVPAPADAQQRAGGLALIAGGTLMTLASGTCAEPDTGRQSLDTTVDGIRAQIRATGGPMIWTDCSLELRFSAPGLGFDTDWLSPAEMDSYFTALGIPNPGIAVAARDEITRSYRPAMLYGGIAAIAAGAVLAILPGGGDTPALDLRAGPQGIRLSRTFGF